MNVEDLKATLMRIRLAATQVDGILGELPELEELSSGVRDGLERCIFTVNSILEEVDGASKKIPRIVERK